MDVFGNEPCSTAKRLKTIDGYIVLPTNIPDVNDTIVVTGSLGSGIYSSEYQPGGG
jgi:hypothetical protein